MDSYKEALMQKIQEIAALIMGDKDASMEPEQDAPDMEEKEEEKELQEQDKAPVVKDKEMGQEELVAKHPGRGPMSFKEKAKAYKS